VSSKGTIENDPQGGQQQVTGVDLDDTIVALATPAGPGARAVVRLSGPHAASVVLAVYSPSAPWVAGQRLLSAGDLQLPGVAAALPADVYFWPAPHSYTGQNIAEIHTLSSPPLVDLLVTALVGHGARPARAGEFTLRAFLAGKLDLTQAEAVQAVVAAPDADELRRALAQLAGGMAAPLTDLRNDLLNLLADVEAALDFTDEDIRFVGHEETLHRLAAALARLTLLRKQLEGRATAEKPLRVVLAGAPNAGKSSLFNALAGASALVSPQPGTTRDYLAATLDLDGVKIELIDTPGWQEAADVIASQAESLRRQQAAEADLVILCIAPEADAIALESETPAGKETPRLAVATKCDLAPPPAGLPATSARTGAGLAEVRARLADSARSRQQHGLAPSLARCRGHIEGCLEHLRRAHNLVLFEDPPELLAAELREALEQLGQMVGAVYTDDLLDRIFSRFCIGK
jgi:tRNA modification GTPase